jgi:hypothetical protein
MKLRIAKQPLPRFAAEDVVAVIERLGGRSSVSGEHVPLSDVSLDRADLRRPFDLTTNCMLLSKFECRSRAQHVRVERQREKQQQQQALTRR